MRADTNFEERRLASRFGRDGETDFAAVRLRAGEELIAAVSDESIHGISLLVDATAPLAVGCDVEIAYAGSTYRAKIIHRRATVHGKAVVGFALKNLGHTLPEPTSSPLPSPFAAPGNS